MEDIHGVSVSWVHHQSRPGNDGRKRATSASSVPRDIKQPLHSVNGSNDHHHHLALRPGSHKPGSFPGTVTPAGLSQPAKSTTTALPTAPSPSSTPPNTTTTKSSSRRPGLLSRSSSERLAGGPPRRTSWISNISNKFSSSSSSSSTPSPGDRGAGAAATANGQAGAAAAQTSPTPALSPYGPGSVPPSTSKTSLTSEIAEEPGEQPYVPAKPKESSFFSTLTRKWSAGSQNGGGSGGGGLPKLHGNKGGVCERRVLNRDPNRERCLVPDMDPGRLRKVSFCVDVEIAGGPRYLEEEDDSPQETEQQKQQRFMDAKAKERAEGDALRRPETIAEEQDETGGGTAGMEKKRRAVLFPQGVPVEKLGELAAAEEAAAAGAQNGHATSPTGDDTAAAAAAADKKKEKKKRSEEERKERKEKRRRRAEENGSIPVELSLEDDPADAPPADPPLDAAGRPTIRMVPNHGSLQQQPQPQAPVTPDRTSRPTTDPVRIYRRCCQLRETPILKRITEQLMSPTCCVPTEPGVVYCLDLTGSRLQLADMVTLGDWLAVVPVKKLLLEDADVPDEGLRCILAGLLAAKRPVPTRRRRDAPVVPRHRDGLPVRPPVQERSGVIEKLVLRNNPRISRHGWKHIGLFLYMCRSIKAIDLSMIKFPKTLPAAASETNAPPAAPTGAPAMGTASVVSKSPPHGTSEQHPHPKHPKTAAAANPAADLDAAEAFYKCLSERLGKARLEEFIVSECGFTAPQIRRIVDAAIVAGINKLGLANNALDDEGLDHVLRYVRSGVCGGLDLGGNDLRGDRLARLAAALAADSSRPCWGLSLAGCNLDAASLKPLFPVLATLPDFRFLDLSHNRDLCRTSRSGSGGGGDIIPLLRRYIGKLPQLKRIHLADVGMDAQQAIALADVLPEGPKLAHVNLLGNPRLTALANARDADAQEEACALYASYMAAVRVSNALICVDIDVPSNDNSEVVKALAKQVVAYSLRNMEQFALAEVTGGSGGGTTAAADAVPAAAASLAGPHGGERKVKEVSVPDVLMHLVGHVDGVAENHDHDEPAPDEDYIVGGTGVVRALQYVLGEKARDLRRTSTPGTPVLAAVGHGTRTPRPGSSSAAFDNPEQRGKAKAMSKNLLESARRIRARLRPALIKEATTGDDGSYRRLLFLDQTLQSMITRFEEEYPECRIAPAASSPRQIPLGVGLRHTETPTPLSIGSDGAAVPPPVPAKNSDEEDEGDYDEGSTYRPAAIRRSGSDASLASRRSRALAIEEGHLHRLGQELRREVIDSPSSGTAPANALSSFASSNPTSSDPPAPSSSTSSPPPISTSTTNTSTTTTTIPHIPGLREQESARLAALQVKLEAISGPELRAAVQRDGWTTTLAAVGANVEDLRTLQEQDPQGWESFKQAHVTARWNLEQQRRGAV